ncbi:unnamed protein product [Acanthoscelides obtectus]|uniref:Uncharacterized protein n=1 Tax=Acanthoscelides obtectus TaxID=200917 RepID=A0A9P0LU46_ACAOB|nr:unnamed protein product [Acanthoscelides obtectus]CAK1638714.1 hypothetical protein AOBTE_LOCUS10775 [Acanthoscelides obtectus]
MIVNHKIQIFVEQNSLQTGILYCPLTSRYTPPPT